MNVFITLPDEIAAQLTSRWTDLPRRALESLAADAYRESVISGPQVQQLLGFSSRLELDSFLRRRRVFLGYSEQDLEADSQALDELLGEGL
ncbi:MAG: UPF0175 family protein [Acidobacteria bacterium]|nr:UPF0175 family protein [Acidobacteriota bacterium]